MKSALKVVASTLCTILTIGVVSVSAQWVVAGYDTTTPGNYGKIYNEVLKGKSTSNHKILPVDEKDIVWRSEGFELAYPHAGYDRLYLEGNWQDIAQYNNTFAQWETRTKDYMWEMVYPYALYQRQQTNIPGIGWRWDYYPQDESKVFTPTNRYADVKANFRSFGIADLRLDETKIGEDVKAMYSRFIGSIVPLDQRDMFSIDRLSQRDEITNEYVISDWEIAANIEIISSKFLTGPALAGPAVKNVAQAYLDSMPNDWKWDSDTVKVDFNGKISWTEEQFESAEPYKYYQFLIVNGMVMDGSNETPRIVRLTSGKATPNITWKYAFAEEEYPYSVVEQKFINGKPVLDENDKPIYRIPTGEFANSKIKVTSTDIEIWLYDDRGGSYLVKSIPKYRGLLGDNPNGNAPGIVDIP